MALDPNILLNVRTLFINKKWPIENINTHSLFNKFCSRLAEFNLEEQKIIIDLAERFRYIQIKDFYETIITAFYCVKEDLYKNCGNIYIAPLKEFYVIKKGKRILNPKSKSADFIYQLFSRMEYRWMDYSYKFICTDNIEYITGNYTTNDRLFLIDDFIGTGETAQKIVKQLIELNIPRTQICIVSIAGQEKGLSYLNTSGIEAYSYYVEKKGISDFYPPEDVSQLKKKMKKMERKIEMTTSKYSLGYKQSEALISILDKSPNNTFPVFWHETDTKLAIFTRYKNYNK